MADDAVEDEPDEHRFRCPGCEEEVDVSADVVGQLVRCPYCSSAFFAADGQTADTIVDGTPPPTPDDVPAEERLDALRIRQLSTLRRATLRLRSWWMIALFLAALAAVNLVAKAVESVLHAHAWGVRPTLLTAAGLAVAAFGVYAGARARQFGREADRSKLPDPADAPDFSTLGDGADRWRQLERIR